MANDRRVGLRIWDRLVLLVAWLVTCGLVYLLGFYVGRGTQERRVGIEERVVRLPVTSTPPPEGQRPKSESEFTFYDTLVAGQPAERRPTEGVAPVPAVEKAAVPTAAPVAAPAALAKATTPDPTPVVAKGTAPAFGSAPTPAKATAPPSAPAKPAGAPAVPAPLAKPAASPPAVPPTASQKNAIAAVPPLARDTVPSPAHPPANAPAPVTSAPPRPLAAATPPVAPQPRTPIAAPAAPRPVAAAPVPAGAVPPIASTRPGPGATPSTAAERAAPTAAAPVPPLASAEAGGWTVLASPTRSRDEAESLLRQLRDRGYDAALVRVQRDGDSWYRLRVGRYATAEQAATVMHRLREHEGVEHAFVANE